MLCRCTLGTEELLLGLSPCSKRSTSLFGISLNRLHFLLLNSFPPAAPHRKWSITAPDPPVCAGGSGQFVSPHRNLHVFLWSIFNNFLFLKSFTNAAIACTSYQIPSCFMYRLSMILTMIHCCNFAAHNSLIKAFIDLQIIGNFIPICICCPVFFLF